MRIAGQMLVFRFCVLFSVPFVRDERFSFHFFFFGILIAIFIAIVVVYFSSYIYWSSISVRLCLRLFFSLSLSIYLDLSSFCLFFFFSLCLIPISIRLNFSGIYVECILPCCVATLLPIPIWSRTVFFCSLSPNFLRRHNIL